jgi:hypothetical protein
MKEKSSEHNQDFYNQLKQKIEGFESDFKVEHWVLMQEKLQKKHNQKRRLGFWVFFCFTLIGGFWFGGYFLNKSNQNANSTSSKRENPLKTKEEQPITPTNLSKDSLLNTKALGLNLPIKPLFAGETDIDTSTGLFISERQKINVQLLANPTITSPLINPIIPANIDKSLLINSLEEKIKSFILNQTINNDSISYKVFERNRHNWKNVVVVCDWTSSMFEYGTQIMTWIEQHIDNPNIKGFVFFNDCDSLGNPLSSHHTKGKMYLSHSTEKNEVLNTMLEAARKGVENDDIPENDLEALLFAIQSFPNAEEFILIADNKSTVKDEYLLAKIQKPIRIIPCGSTDLSGIQWPIQPIYLDLAYQTKGSIHTINEDFLDWKKVLPKKINKILGHNYLFKNGRFKVKK